MLLRGRLEIALAACWHLKNRDCSRHLQMSSHHRKVAQYFFICLILDFAFSVNKPWSKCRENGSQSRTVRCCFSSLIYLVCELWLQLDRIHEICYDSLASTSLPCCSGMNDNCYLQNIAKESVIVYCSCQRFYRTLVRFC